MDWIAIAGGDWVGADRHLPARFGKEGRLVAAGTAMAWERMHRYGGLGMRWFGPLGDAGSEWAGPEVIARFGQVGMAGTVGNAIDGCD